MNITSFDKQTQIIAALTEGCSIRASERLTGTHRDTIMRLGVRVGNGCEILHHTLFRQLHVPLIEIDEVWSFVGKKQKWVTEDNVEQGDQFIFTALDAVNKAILSYRVGKRTSETTYAFCDDLASRIANRPQISSDAFKFYSGAIEAAFGNDAHYAQIVKQYAGIPIGDSKSHRYYASYVSSVKKKTIQGNPDNSKISTSLIERSNLTLRMQTRRLTRLTNAFSKKLENHKAAIALFVAHYNFCRTHETIRTTPAMALNITDHIWSIGELVENALDPQAFFLRLQHDYNRALS